jgi:hypothetical protein
MTSRSPNPLDLLARYWFPAALVGLLLLAIPGFALFALNLMGLEGAINRFLENTFKLSYHPSIPWWGALLLLLVPFFILLLYFLKLKRKPLQVPSTFLWKKSIEDLHVNSLLQWLRQNVLLLLQILAVLAMIYGIMAFRFHGRTGEGKHYIVMIDNSASMSYATDVNPNRLEWAKREALKEIDAAGDNDYGMVIVFNSSAEIRQSYTSNKGLLRAAVEKVEQTQRPTRIEEALTLADSLANPSRSADDSASRPAGVEPGKERTYVQAEGVPTEVHLFSDGRFPDVSDFALGNLSVQFHMAGAAGPESSDNVGIVTFNAVRDEGDPTKLQVLAVAMNYKPQPVSARVQLEVLTNGELKSVYEKSLSLPARKVSEEKEPGKDEPIIRDTPGEGSATFELKDLDERSNVTLHARLRDVKDRFPLDDEAWLVVGVVRKARVLIVGKPNEVLQAFYDEEATQEIATVQRLDPDQLGKDAYLKPALDGAHDLVIFDRCAPAKEADMPRANTFFIGHPPPPWKMSDVEKVEGPHIKGWMNKHAALHYLTALHEVGIGEAFRMKDLPPRTPRLIESDLNLALLLALSRESFTDLVMTFPIITDKGEFNTNWPLLTSFPLFLRNVLYALGNVEDAAGEENTQPGQVKTIRPDAVVDKIDVAPPEGKPVTVERGRRADFSFGATDQVGVYQVAWNGNLQRSFAVNLLDPDESHLEPRNAIQIGAERVAAGETRGQPRDMWKWVVLAGLLLVLVEWYIYNRRVYI